MPGNSRDTRLLRSVTDNIIKTNSPNVDYPFLLSGDFRHCCFLNSIHGDPPLSAIFSRVGCHCACFFNSPVLVRYLCEAFEAIPLTMREEAKLAGTGLLQRFLYLYLPLAAKPLCRGLFLTFVFCFTSFGVILSFGSLKITTPEVAIYSALSTNLNFSKALSVAIIQFLLIAALNVLVTMIPSYERETDTERPCHRPFWTALCSGIWLVFEFIIVLLPLVWAVRYSLQRNPQAILTLFSAGFNRNYPVLRSLANSTLLSCVSAALTSAFAWFLLSLRRKREEMLINALFGISPAMLAISLLYIAILLGLQTPLLLLWGYFIIALPYAYSFLQHQSARFDSAILEQSSVDGAGKLQRFIHIEWPLLSTSFRNVFMQLFAIFFGEFTIAYIFQNGSSFPLASVVSYQLAARRLDIESYLFTSLITFIVITICALFTFVFTDIKGDDKKPL